jgi:2-methylcitrate dehydratase PrpD
LRFFRRTLHQHLRSSERSRWKAPHSLNARCGASADKVRIADAALCNGTVIHGLDFDDTHTGAITHPSTSILSCAFAAGEKLGRSGAEILTAAVAAYEVIVRLGLAADGAFHDAGFHPTGILAPFAGVLAAGKLMHCSMEVIVNALGIAGSQAGTIMEFLHDGSWTKMMHPGWGALSAIYALKMAQAGFTGPKTVFEGQYGVFPVHLGTVGTLPEQLATLGKKWLTPDIAFKLIPAATTTLVYRRAEKTHADHQFTARH